MNNSTLTNDVENGFLPEPKYIIHIRLDLTKLAKLYYKLKNKLLCS